jgi:CHAT domain
LITAHVMIANRPAPIPPEKEAMTIQIWGTFSVRDHLVPRAFITDVLLYDRLVIPTLPEGALEDEWPAAWNLAKQRALLRELGDLAIQIPWDMQLRRAWQQRVDNEFALDRGAASTDAVAMAVMDAGFFRDPQYYDRGDRIVRALLQEKMQAAWPRDVMEAVSAYPSFDAFAGEPNIDIRRLPPTVVFGWKFFFPGSEGLREEEDRRLLEQAIKLANDTDFIRMRANFHRWWRSVAESGMSAAAVRDDMEKRIAAYQKPIQGQGWKRTPTHSAIKVADAFRRLLGPIYDIFAGPAGFLGGAKMFDNGRLALAAGPDTAAIFYCARARLEWKAPPDIRRRKDLTGEKDVRDFDDLLGKPFGASSSDRTSSRTIDANILAERSIPQTHQKWWRRLRGTDAWRPEGKPEPLIDDPFGLGRVRPVPPKPSLRPEASSKLEPDPLHLEPEVSRTNPATPERVIDAHLLAPNFAPGQIASLTVTLRLPGSHVLGQFQGRMVAPLDDGPVTILLQAHGFTILSEPPPPIILVPDRDSAPAAFQLRIENVDDRWLHIIVTQAGRSVGELAINNFASVAVEERQLSVPMQQVREADLTLIVRSGEANAVVSSPRDRACLDFATIVGITPVATSFQAVLRDRLRALYDETANAQEIERELRIVGAELADCLSPQLKTYLRRPDVRTIMLRHDEDFEFPLELCYLDDESDPFFVGDRIATCRWYLGVTNPPDVISKQVGRVAFLRGGDDAAGPDEVMLKRLYPDRTTTFETANAVRERLFTVTDFDLIQFTGHCKVTEKGMGGLEMMDRRFLRIIDIGRLTAERAFTKAQPFVLLNACASAQPYVTLTARDSFAHRFIKANACAFIGTLWPVAGSVANDFAAAFHEALRTNTVGRALLSAKLAVVAKAAEAMAATPTPEIGAVARQVAARSYCLFSHPDLRLAA